MIFKQALKELLGSGQLIGRAESFQAYIDASREHGGNWSFALFADVENARRWIESLLGG